MNYPEKIGNINTVDGLYLLNKAADKGSASAQFTLGNIYREGLGDVPIDLEMAEDWYLKAINNNDEKIAFKAMKNLKLIPGNQCSSLSPQNRPFGGETCQFDQGCPQNRLFGGQPHKISPGSPLKRHFRGEPGEIIGKPKNYSVSISFVKMAVILSAAASAATTTSSPSFT